MINNQFTTKHNRKVELHNGLFHFLKSRPNGINFSEFTFKEKYIIISLPIDKLSQANISSERKIKEWHIRIDECYNNYNNFTSQWHITIIDESGYIYHLYYNAYKFQCSSLNNLALSDQLQSASTYAIALIVDFFYKLEQEQKALNEKLNEQLENLLCSLASDSFNNTQIDKLYTEYSTLLYKLIKINEDANDKILTGLKEKIEQAKIRKKLPSSITSHTSSVDSPSLSSPGAATTKNRKPNKISGTNNNTSIELRVYLELFRLNRIDIESTFCYSSDSDEILRSNDMLANMNQILNELYNKYPYNSSILGEWYLEFYHLNCLILQTYRRLLENMHYQSAEKIHHLVKDKLGINDYMYFLTQIVISKYKEMTSEQEEDCDKFCKYLYTSSANYIKAIAIFFNKHVIFSFNEISAGQSILFKLVANQKYKLFKTFYLQLGGHNIVPQFCGDRTCDFLPLLFYHRGADQLIEFILKHSTPGYCNRVRQLQNDEPFSMHSQGISTTKIMPLIVDVRNLMPRFSTFSAACIHLNNIQPDTLYKIASNSHTFELLLGFTTLFTKTMSVTYCIGPSQERNMEFTFVDNDEEAYQAKEKFTSSDRNAKCLSLNLLFFPKRKEHRAVLEKIATMIKSRLNNIEQDAMITLKRDAFEAYKEEMSITDKRLASQNFFYTFNIAMVILAGFGPQENKLQTILDRINILLKYIEQYFASYGITKEHIIYLIDANAEQRSAFLQPRVNNCKNALEKAFCNQNFSNAEELIMIYNSYLWTIRNIKMLDKTMTTQYNQTESSSAPYLKRATSVESEDTKTKLTTANTLS